MHRPYTRALGLFEHLINETRTPTRHQKGGEGGIAGPQNAGERGSKTSENYVRLLASEGGGCPGNSDIIFSV